MIKAKYLSVEKKISVHHTFEMKPEEAKNQVTKSHKPNEYVTGIIAGSLLFVKSKVII